MGYSIPAAIGAKRADMNRQVIAVCGDGSFQMSFMELATMQQHHIPIKIVVLKNNFLGMVREYQHYTYHDRYSVVNLDGSRIWRRSRQPTTSLLPVCINMDGVEEKWTLS